MGSSQSTLQFNADPRWKSKAIKIPPNEHNKLVILHENTTNQVALLKKISKTGESYSLSFKVTFGDEGDLVIGLAVGEFNPQRDKIERNNRLYVWYMTRKKIVEAGGKQLPLSSPLPSIESGDEVHVKFVIATMKVSIVISRNGREQSHEVTLSRTDLPNKLSPFLGAVNTGLSRASFQILESSIVIHNNNSLTDLTYKIKFTSSFGVITISQDLKKVTRKSADQGNGCALLPVKLSSGVHRWKFVVHCDFGASLCIGLARYPFRLSTEYVNDPTKHIYRHPGLLVYRSYRGMLYKDGKQQESLDALSWQHNTSVTMELLFDANKGTLEIFRNNIPLGVAFRDLTGTYQPVVCYYASYEKEVELKQYLTTEESLDILQSPPSSLDIKKPKQEIDLETISFDESSIYGILGITEDKKAVYREKTQSGNAFCFLNVNCSKLGTYRFSYIIEYDHGASTCLGVTQAIKPSEVKLSDVGNIYISESLYLYRSFQGMLYVKGKEQTTRLEEFWMSGSLVEMEVNVASNESSVTFKVNAMDQGIAFSGLQPPLMPVVAFYAGMEKRVTILHYEFIPVDMGTELTDIIPSMVSRDGSNDTMSILTHASKDVLPILCSSSDAVAYIDSCMKCKAANNVIALPCKHSTVCCNHLSLGLNSPARYCLVCSEKVTQIWNILMNR